MSIPLCNAIVVERRDLTQRLVILRIRPAAEPMPAFVPGQFVQIGLPCGEVSEDAARRFVKHAYSIASSPADTEAFELLLALVPGGRLTPSLWTLQAGEECWMDSRPLGAFTLEHVPAGKNLVLVATGTGIAPYVSMVRAYACGSPLHQPGRWARCVVIHGARCSEDLAYAAELRSYCGRDPTLRYVPILSREPEASPWAGLRGRVQAVLDDELLQRVGGAALDPSTSHVFLCGNPNMIEEARALLVARGFTAGSARRGGNLHTERYW